MKCNITFEEALTGTPRDKALFIAQTYLLPIITQEKPTSTEEERDKIFDSLTKEEPKTKADLERIKKETEEFWSYINFTDRTKDLDLLLSYQLNLFVSYRLSFQKNIQIILQELFTTIKIENFYNKISKELPKDNLEIIKEHIEKEIHFSSFYPTIENGLLKYKVYELSRIYKEEIEDFTYRFSELKSFLCALDLYIETTKTKEFIPKSIFKKIEEAKKDFWENYYDGRFSKAKYKKDKRKNNIDEERKKYAICPHYNDLSMDGEDVVFYMNRIKGVMKKE